MELFVERSCRRLVADHLGVGVEQLVAGVSLREDLAADSLDLVELAMALEAKFGIVVPERLLDRVRTYGDLRSEEHTSELQSRLHLVCRLLLEKKKKKKKEDKNTRVTRACELQMK